MLQSLSVKQFKYIWSKELKLDDFSDINIFVWKNGSWKTSALESIFWLIGLNKNPSEWTEYSFHVTNNSSTFPNSVLSVDSKLKSWTVILWNISWVEESIWICTFQKSNEWKEKNTNLDSFEMSYQTDSPTKDIDINCLWSCKEQVSYLTSNKRWEIIPQVFVDWHDYSLLHDFSSTSHNIHISSASWKWYWKNTIINGANNTRTWANIHTTDNASWFNHIQTILGNVVYKIQNSNIVNQLYI